MGTLLIAGAGRSQSPLIDQIVSRPSTPTSWCFPRNPRDLAPTSRTLHPPGSWAQGCLAIRGGFWYNSSCEHEAVAQWIERWVADPKVVGSSPIGFAHESRPASVGSLLWRGVRVVEGTRLENERGCKSLRGFESHPLRHEFRALSKDWLVSWRGRLVWPMALAWKAGKAQAFVGSNPTLSALGACLDTHGVLRAYPGWGTLVCLS